MTVYVPLDGSERAERALAPATALAACTGAELVLFATPWPHTSTETMGNYLSVQAAFVGQPARPWLVLDRSPVDAIRTAATEPGALVCMTTRGRGVAKETLLGSVAADVVRTSAAPVLFVGPNVAAEWTLGDDPLVLAGLDGSAPSRVAARAAGDLAVSMRARVRAVEVLRPSDVITVGEFPGGDLAMLKEVTAELEQRGLTADYTMVDGYDAADTLAKLAVSGHATAIAVASHGRTGLAHVMLGSIAMRTIRQAPCPVLVTGPAVHRHATDGAIATSQEPSSQEPSSA